MSFRFSKDISSNFGEEERTWEVFRSKSEKENDSLYNKGMFPYTLIYKKDSSQVAFNDGAFYGERAKADQTF